MWRWTCSSADNAGGEESLTDDVWLRQLSGALATYRDGESQVGGKQGLMLDLLMYQEKSLGKSDQRHTFGRSQCIGSPQSRHMGEIILSWWAPEARPARHQHLGIRARIWALQRTLGRSSQRSRKKLRREESQGIRREENVSRKGE